MARQLPPWLIELQENRPQLFQDLPEYGSEIFKESGLADQFKGRHGRTKYDRYVGNIESQRQAVIEGARPRSSFKGKDFTKLPVMPSLERTVKERVGRGSWKNVTEWQGPDGEWSRFDPIIDRSYSADDDVRNIPASKQLNIYEESNRSQALADAERKRLGSQSDGNPTSSSSYGWGVNKDGVYTTSGGEQLQLPKTNNTDVTVAGFKVGSFDNNTQETTKPAKIPNSNYIGNMTQLELEQTDYGSSPNESPARNSVRQNKETIKSINNPSGETNPIQDSKSSGADVWKPEGLFDTKNIESMPDFKESIKMGEKLKLSEGSGMNMDKINALLSVAKELGIGQSKKKEGTGKPMDTNVNIDQIASSNLDPWLNFYQV